jgi:hypothetical protein
MSFISFNEATPSLSGDTIGQHNRARVGLTDPLKPAFSCINLLKSAMSLSIASRICKCRTSVHTESVSDKIATLSSYSPRAVWNLYLMVYWLAFCIRVRECCHSPILCTIVDRQQIVTHSLVREFVQERCKGIHSTISDKQNPTRT